MPVNPVRRNHMKAVVGAVALIFRIPLGAFRGTAVLRYLVSKAALKKTKQIAVRYQKTPIY